MKDCNIPMPNTTRHNTSLAEAPRIGIKKLFSYFLPELITAWLLYIALEIIDFRFIACTDTVSCSTTLVISNSLLHLITKVAEGFSVGMVILCGQHNGAHDYPTTGKILTTGIWVTTFIGAVIACGIYIYAPAIYAFYEVPDTIITLGVPFLRIRVIGVFFSFIYFVLIGFLRGIKNTKAPMFLFLLGACVFLFFDYALIFGAWGFPALGLTGSALATVFQYGSMLLGALVYILYNRAHEKYKISLLCSPAWTHVQSLLRISCPVMIDKASIAFCPTWLTKLVGSTARMTNSSVSHLMLESYTVLRTMERVGILPAVAFSQVITFLISNDYKVHHFGTIRRNIRLVLLCATLLVGVSTIMYCLWPEFFLSLLGKEKSYNSYIGYS
ncbi:polysaccharide biosynthesis C-terminal domain-containing protein, partial [Candidatus Dependentiae bacterium]|nr:polysaccharide biosynthesis C-terminal domain-containing protein [Candidatus Dependentiae bacterium]